MCFPAKEDVFLTLMTSGACVSFSIDLDADGFAVLSCDTNNGRFVVHTKRGEVKKYKVETALKFLRFFGFHSVSINMADWRLLGPSTSTRKKKSSAS